MSTSIPASTKTRRKTFTRRALLAGGGLVGCCVLVSGGGTLAWFLANRGEDMTGELDFTNPLVIPPLLEGDLAADGRRTFDLVLQTGGSAILPDKETETWGVNGPLLGPTLRARRGETVAMRVHNELPEDTSIHWHGMHLPPEMDGGPHQMIAVGETWEPSWIIEQPAATLWYHPHPHGQTAEHVYKGIAGMIVLDDDDADALALPSDYGVDDIPLILQDRDFTGDGQLTMNGTSFLEELGGQGNFGVMGDTMLVNGTWNPHLEVDRSLVRFRLLNGSNARFYSVGFEDDRQFHLVGTDNGLLPGEPVSLNRLPMGPGERAEIVVAFEPGEDVIMRSFSSSLGPNGGSVGGEDTLDLLLVRAVADLDDVGQLPGNLGGQAVPDTREVVTERSFSLDGHRTINGEEMDMSRIDEVIPAGALEIWDVESNGQPHTFHIHGATFHVLDVDGEDPDAHLRGPKDTVFVGNGHPVRLAVQFLEHTNPEMPYMYHCHILRHEDNGMMGQFVVVEPGTESSVDRTIDLEGHSHH